jgi:hypothetical protein
MEIEIINKPMLCWDYDEQDAKEYHVLAKITNSETEFKYKGISNEGYSIAFICAKSLPISNRTLKDGLYQGDIIVDSEGHRIKILGVCGEVYLTSELNDFSISGSQFKLEELINGEFRLVQEDEDTAESNLVHLTIQDISKGRGKGIDPKRIRIKE